MKIVKTVLAEESRILKILREQYEADGYSFYEHPPQNLLPNALDDFRPDAIAINNTEKILIEVVSRKSKQKSERLEMISNILESETDWQFRLVFADSFGSKNHFSRQKVKLQLIQNAIIKTEELEEYEFWNEGFLLQWSILEAITVHLMENSDLNNSYNLSLKSILSFLEQEGHLSFRDTKTLRKLLNVRHQIAHGGLNFNISKKEYSKLDGLIRSLFSEIMD